MRFIKILGLCGAALAFSSAAAEERVLYIQHDESGWTRFGEYAQNSAHKIAKRVCVFGGKDNNQPRAAKVVDPQSHQEFVYDCDQIRRDQNY